MTTEEKLRNEPTQLRLFGIGKAIETAEKQQYDGISRDPVKILCGPLTVDCGPAVGNHCFRILKSNPESYSIFIVTRI